jgi:hypothetical protein
MRTLFVLVSAAVSCWAGCAAPAADMRLAKVRGASATALAKGDYVVAERAALAGLQTAPRL